MYNGPIGASNTDKTEGTSPRAFRTLTRIKLALCALLLLFSISFATDRVVHQTAPSCAAGADYATIQGAIDASSDGDTITVCNDGIYTENVVVNQSVNIYGNESGVAVSGLGNPSIPVFSIESNFVNLSNFNAQNSYSSYGVYLAGNDTQISEVNSQSNYYGFYLQGSNNSLTNNTAYGNSYGFYLISSSGNNFTNNTATSNSLSFYLSSSSNNDFTGSTATGGSYGFYLSSSSDNNFTNTTANSSAYGFYLISSSNNDFSDSVAQENSIFDFYILDTSDGDCNNLVTNMNGSGGRPINYTNETVTWANLNVSELVLCNADGSTLDNVTIDGSDSLNNNGLLMIRTDNAAISNFNSSDNYYGFYLTTSSNNNFTGNTASSNSQYGFYLTSSSDNNFTASTANSNSIGFYLSSSPNNILTTSTANSNSYGFFLTSSSDNNFTASTADSNSIGFFIASSSDNNFTASTANNNSEYGFYLSSSSDDNFTNTTANSNSIGFYLSSSPNNNFTDSIAQENSQFDLFVQPDSGSCNNIITNMTGSGGRPINYTNETVDWNNLVSSEIVLCNADGSTLDNGTVAGSDGLNNNGFLIFETNNAIISNFNSSNNYYGFYLQSSSDNNFTASTANSNPQSGFYLYFSSNNDFADSTANNNSIGFSLSSSSNNILTTSTANSNSQGFTLSSSSGNNFTTSTANSNAYGFFLASSSNNNFTTSTANDNSNIGFYLDSGSGNTLTNSTANSNPYGFYLASSPDSTLTANHFYNNSADFIVAGGSTNTNMTENIFDNPLGNFQDFTNLSFFKSTSDNGYTIAWTAQPAVPPLNLTSFRNKFIDISAINGTLFDSITWGWTDGETNEHNESSFQLWKFNGTDWALLNDTPDTSANALSVSNFDSFSDFAILEIPLNCPVITSPGSFQMSTNFVGAPNDASPLSDLACVNIITSDVVFDCNGFNITNDGTSGTTYGVLLNGSLDNITIENCAISNYTNGIYVYNSTNSLITNSIAYNNTWEIIQKDSVLFNVFNSQLGDPVNISINDSTFDGSAYGIKETTSPGAAPQSSVSFRGKYLKVNFTGTGPLDNLTFLWNTTEALGFDEGAITLFTWNGTGWAVTPNQTTDPSTHSLSALNLANITSDDIYGLFAAVANVSVLKLNQTAAQPSPGGIVQFNMTVTNTGNAILNGTLVDSLPPGLTFLSASPANDSAGPGWNFSLDPGNSAAFYINATVDSGVVDSANTTATLTNCANATGTPPNGDNVSDLSCADVTVLYANISVIKVGITPVITSPGGIVQWQINVSNSGEVTLNPILVTDTLPPGFGFNGSTPAPDSTDNITMNWTNVGPLTPGGSTIILLNSTVGSNVSNGTYTNTVTVIGVPPNGQNVTVSDNATVGVYAPAINLVKTVNQTLHVPIRQNVTYALNISNTGSANLTVTVVDILPANVAFNGADVPPTSVAGQVVRWVNVTVIAPGGSFAIHYNASANHTGTYTNNATATGVPPNGNNVSDRDSATFTTLAPPPPPSSNSGSGSLTSYLTISDKEICPGDVLTVTVTSGSSPVENAYVKVYNTGTSSMQDAHTDSQGNANFTLQQSAPYNITAEKSGYNDAPGVTLDYTQCSQQAQNQTPPAGVHCSKNENCSANQHCVDARCVDISVSNCGYVSNHTWINYTCCADSDCQTGYACVLHGCSQPTPPPQNLTNQTTPNVTQEDAQRAIIDAQSAIDSANSQGKDTSAAAQKLQEAQVAYDAGNYTQALDLVQQAKALAQNAAAGGQQPVQPIGTGATPLGTQGVEFICLPVIMLIVIAAVGGAIYYFFLRPKR